MLSEYCERAGDGFWAEPLNAISNAAFILVALVLYVSLRRAGARDWAALLLVTVIFAIGIGSFLFHTQPNSRTMLADIIPIQLFILGYLFLAIRRFFGGSVLLAGGAVALYLLGSLAFEGLWPYPVQGSSAYLPALATLLIVGMLLIGRAHGAAWRLGKSAEPAREAALGMRAAFAGRTILIAGVLFCVSLMLRTIDRPLCGQFASGTHFLWHLCNALLLLILMRTAIRHGPDAPEQM